MLIGICGFAGAGKDTIADYLTANHDFYRVSFAATLKDAVATVFGWDRQMLEGRTPESRAWRENVDTWWATRLNMPHLTPRWVLQYWGTEVCRVGFHDDMWIASLEYKIRNSKCDVVITDCRFPNEIKSIKNQGGKVIWVQRGPLPEWYSYAHTANTPGANPELMATHFPNVHASEWAWIGTEFDAILDNNGTRDALSIPIERFLKNPESNRPFSTVYEVRGEYVDS